jgi:hypothetical protein
MPNPKQTRNRRQRVVVSSERIAKLTIQPADKQICRLGVGAYYPTFGELNCCAQLCGVGGYKHITRGKVTLLGEWFWSSAAASLHLADNFAGFAQAFHHLLAFFAPSDGVVALFEEVVELLRSIHLLE